MPSRFEEICRSLYLASTSFQKTPTRLQTPSMVFSETEMYASVRMMSSLALNFFDFFLPSSLSSDEEESSSPDESDDEEES